MAIGMRFRLIDTFRHRYLYHLGKHQQRREMSYEASLAKLTPPLKDLVANVQVEAGKTDADQAEIVNFIDKVAREDIVKSENLHVSIHPGGYGQLSLICYIAKELETLLTPRTYLVGNYFTAADVALYGALHPTLVCLSFMN